MSELPGVTFGSKVTTTDVLRVSVEPPESPSEAIFITPNLCDRTTWYPEATRVVDEIATCDDPGTYTLYSVANPNLIDTYHGKIPGEDDLLDSESNSYRVTVKVNDVAKTEQDPHLGSGGDYTVNYDTGVVTMLAALTGPDVVKVTYHHETGSAYTLAPLAGKVLKLVKAEFQLSDDMIMNDTMLLEILVGGTPVKFTRYKSMTDLYSESQGTYPSLPALGGSGWRGLTQALHTLPFIYLSVSALQSSYGLALRTSLEHNAVFGGTFATATFYCLSEDE